MATIRRPLSWLFRLRSRDCAGGIVMSRYSLRLGIALALGSAWVSGAAAQGDLQVTMRVLDDVTNVDAVILVIGNIGDSAADAVTRDPPQGVASSSRVTVDPSPASDAEAPGKDRDVVEAPAEESAAEATDPL